MSDFIDNNLYIPLCGKTECKLRLQEIATLVKNCTTEHEMYGSYAAWFEHHFGSHAFTMIHHCPYLWKKVRFFKEEMRKMDKKLILLNLDFADITENALRCDQAVVEDLNAFFSDFGAEHIVSNDQQLLSFGKDVVKCIKKHFGYEEDEGYGQSDGLSDMNSSQLQTESIPDNPEDSPEYAEPGGYQEPDLEIEDFKKCPNIFGETNNQHVFVKECFTSDSSPSVQVYKQEKSLATGDNINALLKDSPQEMTSNNRYILLKTLPEIYARKDLPALASVCICKNIALQKRALVLLELCIWEGINDNPDLESKYLHNAESTLAAVLTHLKNKFLSSKDNVYLALLERASNVYYMIISAIIMCSQHNEEAEFICNSYLDTIRSRFNDPLDKSLLKHKKLTECLRKRDQFVAASKDFLMVKDKTISTLQKVTIDDKTASKCARDLSSKSLIVQVVVTFSMLKKLFDLDQDLNLNSLTFLKQYLGVQKGINVLRKKEPESICIVMVFRAVTLFLKYHSQRLAHKDIQDLCKKTVNILHIASQRELTPEVMRALHSLMFHPNFVVREGILNILDERNKLTEKPDMRKKRMSDHYSHSVMGILDLYLSGMVKKRIDMLIGPNWNTHFCQFENKKAVLCFHVISGMELRQDIRTPLENHKDMSYNEMNHLIQLQHKNIIQLFAYQRSQVPMFYILEDCSQNVQTVMLNYRNNGQYFTHLELCHFLLNTATALQYCHDKNFLHRNLTAHCLAFCQNKSVKLGSFGLCVGLGQSLNVIDLENQQNIPFRWSAPESLFSNEYTKASDIWMLGVLIYELMTHGVLPFSSWRFRDLELGQKLKAKSVGLTSERCLDEGMEQLMADCTNYEPESRPYIENVKTQIVEIIQKWTHNQRTTELYPYPKFENSLRLSSVSFKRGLPFELQNTSVESAIGDSHRKSYNKYAISDILVLLKLTNGQAIFLETIRSMSPTVLSLFQTDKIKSVLRQTIKYCQSRDSEQYLVMTIPPSDSLLSKIESAELNSLQTVLEVVYQVAVILSKIASMDLILGDFYPSAVYVNQQNYRDVYIMSLAFMRKPGLETYQIYDDNQPNIPKYMIPRAAPEVIGENNFSKQTDVYCFGSFLWETLTALNVSFNPAYVNTRKSPFCYVPTDQIKSEITNEWEDHNPCPECCPDKIYQLIKSCVSDSKIQRPSMKHVLNKLNEYYEELFGVVLEEFVPGSEGDLSNYVASTKYSLSECNPSTRSCQSEVTSDIYETDISSMISTLGLREANPSSISDTTWTVDDNDVYESSCSYTGIDYQLHNEGQIDEEEVYGITKGAETEAGLNTTLEDIPYVDTVYGTYGTSDTPNKEEEKTARDLPPAPIASDDSDTLWSDNENIYDSFDDYSSIDDTRVNESDIPPSLPKTPCPSTPKTAPEPPIVPPKPKSPPKVPPKPKLPLKPLK